MLLSLKHLSIGSPSIRLALVLLRLFGTFLPSDACAQTLQKNGLDLFTTVNWDFHGLPKLEAWLNSATVLRKTLDEWYPSRVQEHRATNVDFSALRAVFAQTANVPANDWSVVYLASHQGRFGLWHFPQDLSRSWPEILAGNPSPLRPPLCLVVDACYAEAADPAVLLQGSGSLGILYASGRAELAHELNFHQRFPIDLSRQFPAEAKWLRDALGSAWNGRISFLGFIWLRAFLATPHTPRNSVEWRIFFHACENLAAEFRHGPGESLAASIHFIERPDTNATESDSAPDRRNRQPLLPSE